MTVCYIYMARGLQYRGWNYARAAAVAIGIYTYIHQGTYRRDRVNSSRQRRAAKGFECIAERVYVCVCPCPVQDLCGRVGVYG